MYLKNTWIGFLADWTQIDVALLLRIWCEKFCWLKLKSGRNGQCCLIWQTCYFSSGILTIWTYAEWWIGRQAGFVWVYFLFSKTSKKIFYHNFDSCNKMFFFWILNTIFNVKNYCQILKIPWCPETLADGSHTKSKLIERTHHPGKLHGRSGRGRLRTLPRMHSSTSYCAGWEHGPA